MRMRTRLALLLASLSFSTWTAAEQPDLAAAMQLPDFAQLPASTPLQEETAGQIYFPTVTPYDFDVLINPAVKMPVHQGMGVLVLPARASAKNPVPAVVLVHGSGGLTPGRESRYAALLAANGYAALYIDYYQPRGITESTPYIAKMMGVTEFDAAADAYAALRALNQHPAVDGKRVALAGFSYGGMATRIALDARVRDALAADLPPFAAHVDFYGPCFQDFQLSKTTGAPLLSLRGAKDASNDLVACAQREAELRVAGSEVSSVIYARAGHVWEADIPRAMSNNPYIAGCTMLYDEKGIPSVDGKPLIPAQAGTGRKQRYQLRLTLEGALGSCVKVGYIVGRDDETRVQADYQFLQFLRQTLR